MTHSVRAHRPATAVVFLGFVFLILTDSVLVGVFNPDRNQGGFWIELAIVCGGFLMWAAFIWIRLRQGKGVVAAYGFLSLLTAMIGIGAIIEASGGYPPQPDFPGWRILYVARVGSGLFVIMAFIVIVTESLKSDTR